MQFIGVSSYLVVVNKALSHYEAILNHHREPRFQETDLQPLIERGQEILHSCRLCSHLCEIDRQAGELGWCEVGDSISVASAFDHVGEEPFLVPSFAIFFNSCTFSCDFCQNWDISQTRPPRLSLIEGESELAALIDRHSYCRNVNFVGGEPTPYLPFILSTLREVTCSLPVVWNSNFYMSPETMEILAEFVDFYLPDFKFGNDLCAERLAKIENYNMVVRRNLLTAASASDVLIRHLIMPGHLDCCSKPVIDFIAENLGEKVLVNLMDQYHPAYRAKGHSELDRRLARSEFEEIVEYARAAGLNFIS